MQVFENERAHLPDFIRLNEQWIRQYFEIEDADRALAANPEGVLERGGHIFSLVDEGVVVGVCALFYVKPGEFELARMAVAPEWQGHGCGDQLLEAALRKLQEIGAQKVFLLSNTILEPAIALYQKHGFETVSLSQHPVYQRCNIVMERALR